MPTRSYKSIRRILRITEVTLLTLMGIVININAAHANSANEPLEPIPLEKSLVELYGLTPNTAQTQWVTITLPSQGQHRFTKLSLTEQTPTAPPLAFDLPNIRAFIGPATAPGTAIALAPAWIDETGTLWIEFNTPLPANTTLTLALATPTVSPGTPPPVAAAPSVYGVAAYPALSPSAPIFAGEVTLLK
jgi:hypothetical protein